MYVYPKCIKKLYSGVSGLLDPCERDQVDSISYLSPESRELITYTAQVGHPIVVASPELM